jgi:hypothetical protein
MLVRLELVLNKAVYRSRKAPHDLAQLDLVQVQADQGLGLAGENSKVWVVHELARGNSGHCFMAGDQHQVRDEELI